MNNYKKFASHQKPKSLDEKLEKSVKVMDIILVFVGILLVTFTVAMIVIFVNTGGIPDTLVGCVFAACTGELGIMGWIKSTKDKYYNRAIEKENSQIANDIQDDKQTKLEEVDFFE